MPGVATFCLPRLAVSLETKVEIRKVFEVRDYDLAATLTSGQAFRWKQNGEDWVGVVAGKWVRIRQENISLARVGLKPEDDNLSEQNSLSPPRADERQHGRENGPLTPTLSPSEGEREKTGLSRLVVETAEPTAS